MNFTAKKPDLQTALALCASVIERRNTIPILSNVLLSQDDGKLRITATDMDMELDVVVEASFLRGEHEPITLPAQTFSDIVKKAASESISLTTKGGNATLKAGSAKFSLGLLPAADFPVFAHNPGSAEFAISAGDIAALIAAVEYAISRQEARYYLGGIFLTPHDADGTLLLRAVATDGNRMAYRDAPSIDATLGDFEPIILPRKTCDALSKIVENTLDAAITARFSKQGAQFELPGITLRSKLIDGSFPDYTRVIPSRNERSARLHTKPLADALARVCCVIDTKPKAAKLSFTEKHLVVSAKSPDGSAEEEIPCVAWTGGSLEIGFNAGFLLDALGKMGDTVELLMNDPASPVILHSIENDHRQPDRLDLLMPMRVN